MVDCSAYEVIDIETVNFTGRDGTMRVLEVVWYVPEAHCNIISIGLYACACFGSQYSAIAIGAMRVIFTNTGDDRSFTGNSQNH